MLQHTVNHETLHHHEFSEKLGKFFHSPAVWATLLLLAILTALVVLGWFVGGSSGTAELPYTYPMYPYML